MTALVLQGRWVLVTGASSGLGLEMARQLAQEHKANLVLVARRLDRLEALKQELESKAGVQVVALRADLSSESECNRLFREATTGRQLSAVILNAGMTFFGRFVDQAPQNVADVVNTNVASVATLTHLSAAYLVAQAQQGALMLVSSTGGSTPLPFQAVYGATKAFVTSLGCAVAQELEGTGVSVTVFAPGGMATEMSHLSGLSKHYAAGHPAMMDAVTCARIALAGMTQRQSMTIPGLLNRLGGMAGKLLPRAFVLWAIKREYSRALPPRRP